MEEKVHLIKMALRAIERQYFKGSTFTEEQMKEIRDSIGALSVYVCNIKVPDEVCEVPEKVKKPRKKK